ncbi:MULTISPECIES: heavy-metal-associated domain-containing protein [unclassified Microbacterium]|uniref:heavy-metal-associated domain-containing protein n=1 Tax=unclassified Microbacterium TaxID=2609290 RepID=UPI000EA9CD8F|nr:MULTISPECIES: heavy-metal-associated domain-containing protein [unclassified Microbacterium]MBT2483549.1 heavy-metal-associated domain-containing protein [Microbacterium sp. ISL-108]RKN66561.1 heavy-metal-associated domain-containing protein [Microbacterium sp. CGR2]
MNAGARLAVYGLGLVVAFGGAFGLAQVIVPASVVGEWTKGAEMKDHGDHGTPATATEDSAHAAAAALKGLSLSIDGYVLSPVDAPTEVGAAGELSFQIQDAAGTPVTEYATAHDKDLHLIVARSDGSEFRHVHPTLDESTGTWSLPWEWTEAGTYRVFADFTPAGTDAPSLTLTRTVQVAGDFTPVVPEPTRVAHVDGFTVSLDGDLEAGSASDLILTVTREGEPVTTLEPYLGAFGHLVALRDGDLAYLHVHAEGDEPEAGETSGPEIAFAAEAPSAGRYLLYLDFQVDGQVHTAEFVLEAAHQDDGATESGSGSHEDGH